MQALLSHSTQDDSNGASPQAFADQALPGCLQLLEDAEPRVRLAVGECLGIMAQQRGPSVWEASKDTIFTSIEGSWVRGWLQSLLSYRNTRHSSRAADMPFAV